ncbi:MAG TPA: PAS domain S-box protein, partial [Spirochaetia bacterium]|nr:PAS domain S-box protein [Spirochaetia bacterium]
LIHKRFAGEPGKADENGTIYGELSARGYYERENGTGRRRFAGTIGVIRDITRRKKAEGLLRRLLSAVDQTPVSIIITDAGGVIDYINPQFIRTTGFTPQEVIGHTVSVLKSHYHPEEFYKALGRALREHGEWSGEIINRKKNGDYYWNSVVISAVRDPEGTVTNYISIQEDITEKKRTAQEIKSLREKEILLREIHHRVKNNLQVITSLLNLQCSAITEEKFIDIFKKCENRIKSMALIHEKLYQSQDIARVEFGDYLTTLVFHLMQAHREDMERISIEVKAVKLYFDIDTAIPAGLIVNELITNAIFHAFPDNRRGRITVRLAEKDDHALIEVIDDGRGFQGDFEKPGGEGLGLQLVRVLVKQLHGTLTLNRKTGTRLAVVVPVSS